MATVPRVLMVVCEEDSGARSAKKVVELCSSGSEDTSVSVMKNLLKLKVKLKKVKVKFVGTLGIHGSVNVHKTGDSNNGGR